MADVIKRVSVAAMENVSTALEKTGISKADKTGRSSVIDRAMSPPPVEDWQPQRVDKMKRELTSPYAPMASLADSAGKANVKGRLVPLAESADPSGGDASGSLVQALVMVVGEERARYAAADFVAEDVTTITQLLELGYAELMTLGKVSGLDRAEMCQVREAAAEVQAQYLLETQKWFGTPRPGEFEVGRDTSPKGLGSCRSCMWFGAKTKNIKKAPAPPRNASPGRSTSPVVDRRRRHEDVDFYAHVPLNHS